MTLQSLKIFIVNIKDINNVDSANSPWISAPDEMEEGIRSALRVGAPNSTITVIGTLADFDSLLTSPPEGALVLNTHGESVPCPARFSDWRIFFEMLGDVISSKGWIFVSVTGAPLHYYGTQQRALEALSGQTRGRNIVLSKAVKISTINPQLIATVATMTGEGMRAHKLVNIEMPNQFSVSRCMLVGGELPEIVFYSVGLIFGAASFRIGSFTDSSLSLPLMSLLSMKMGNMLSPLSTDSFDFNAESSSKSSVAF